MDTVLRAATVYFVLLLLFRITGNRSMAQITVFDFVLLLIISESAQQGITANDYSVVNSVILISTLAAIDILISLFKQRFSKIDRVVDGLPLILVRQGEMLKDRMEKARVDEADILEAARELQGLEGMRQIKYAVLERSGDISIIPWDQPAAPSDERKRAA